MHRLNSVVDEAIKVLVDDLEHELKAIETHPGHQLHDAMIHEVRETITALSEAIHIKYHMGWIEKEQHSNPHNPY